MPAWIEKSRERLDRLRVLAGRRWFDIRLRFSILLVKSGLPKLIDRSRDALAAVAARCGLRVRIWYEQRLDPILHRWSTSMRSSVDHQREVLGQLSARTARSAAPLLRSAQRTLEHADDSSMAGIAHLKQAARKKFREPLRSFDRSDPGRWLRAAVRFWKDHPALQHAILALLALVIIAVAIRSQRAPKIAPATPQELDLIRSFVSPTPQLPAPKPKGG